jgi:putative restriction endonuclease
MCYTDTVMAYWWVAQSKTWKQERAGGYMWAPNRNKVGITPHHWATMNEVQAGDIVFSFVEGRIVAVGVASSAAYASRRPADFRDTSVWKQDGKRVDIVYEDVKPPLPLSSILTELRPLLPVKYSPVNAKGTGNEGYLFGLPPRAGRLLLEHTRGDAGRGGTDLVEEALTRTVGDQTEREAVVKSRIGQGRYRQALLSLWGSCAVTDLDIPELLRASHIKPWSDCNGRERLDVYNGLLLSPAYDAAFDAGFISFADDGSVLVSPLLSKAHVVQLGLSPTARISSLRPENLAYLAYHRSEVFLIGGKTQVA